VRRGNRISEGWSLLTAVLREKRWESSLKVGIRNRGDEGRRRLSTTMRGKKKRKVARADRWQCSSRHLRGGASTGAREEGQELERSWLLALARKSYPAGPEIEMGPNSEGHVLRNGARGWGGRRRGEAKVCTRVIEGA